MRCTAHERLLLDVPLVEILHNVIACENGIRATSQLREEVYKHLSAEEAAWCDAHVGFADCSVDRIVPPVRSENPIDVVVENFYEWNVEEKSFVGGAPHITMRPPRPRDACRPPP